MQSQLHLELAGGIAHERPNPGRPRPGASPCHVGVADSGPVRPRGVVPSRSAVGLRCSGDRSGLTKRFMRVKNEPPPARVDAAGSHAASGGPGIRGGLAWSGAVPSAPVRQSRRGPPRPARDRRVAEAHRRPGPDVHLSALSAAAQRLRQPLYNRGVHESELRVTLIYAHAALARLLPHVVGPLPR